MLSQIGAGEGTVCRRFQCGCNAPDGRGLPGNPERVDNFWRIRVPTPLDSRSVNVYLSFSSLKIWRLWASAFTCLSTTLLWLPTYHRASSSPIGSEYECGRLHWPDCDGPLRRPIHPHIA